MKYFIQLYALVLYDIYHCYPENSLNLLYLPGPGTGDLLVSLKC
jgi:hypothetical protein